MRNIIVFYIGLVVSDEGHGKIDPNCPDYHLNTVCHDICVEETFKCIMACEQTDSECAYVCLRAGVTCVESCPCDIDCPNGCSDCENSICECSDVTANVNWNKCLDANGSSLARCIYNCENNGNCEDDCVSEFKARTENCPCEENCSAGCPCDYYECEEVHQTTAIITSTAASLPSTTAAATTYPTTTESTKTEAVLMLTTYQASNVPMVIGLNGAVDDDINFTFESNTEVDHSCAATLNNEMWIFGGVQERRQLSKIQECKLKNVGQMPFDLYGGGCNTFSYGILLCFCHDHTKECHSFNGVNFKSEPSARFSHMFTALGSYRNSPFVTGNHHYLDGIKTEILDYNSKRWVQAADFPFSNGDRISYYASVSTEKSVFIIGGMTSSSIYANTIAKYESNNWFAVGKLNQSRARHGAVIAGSMTMIVGGYSLTGQTDTELWDWDTSEGKITNPTLSTKYQRMSVFLVDVGYCSKS